MCLPVLTPMAILSRGDGGKQEMSPLLEMLHPLKRGAGNQMSLSGGQQEAGARRVTVSVPTRPDLLATH